MTTTNSTALILLGIVSLIAVVGLVLDGQTSPGAGDASMPQIGALNTCDAHQGSPCGCGGIIQCRGQCSSPPCQKGFECKRGKCVQQRSFYVDETSIITFNNSNSSVQASSPALGQ